MLRISGGVDQPRRWAGGGATSGEWGLGGEAMAGFVLASWRSESGTATAREKMEKKYRKGREKVGIFLAFFDFLTELLRYHRCRDYTTFIRYTPSAWRHLLSFTFSFNFNHSSC
jgi:hypothetical protein